MVLDSTIKVDKRLKDKLTNLDFVKKNQTYNEIVSFLVERYKKEKDDRFVKYRRWKR